MPRTLVYYLKAGFVAIYCLEELLQFRLECSATMTSSQSFESSNLTSGSLWCKEFCSLFFIISLCFYSISFGILLLGSYSVPKFTLKVEICYPEKSPSYSDDPTAIF